MLRNALACLLATAVLLTASSIVHAQDAPPDAPEQPEEPQAKAQRLFKEGLEAEKAQDFDTAIKKYEGAYEAYNDALIYVRIGQAYQLRGNRDTNFDDYKKSVEAYQKFLELVPDADDATLTEVNKRITDLEKALADEEDRKKKQIEDEKQAKIEEARLKREEEERKRKKQEELEGMRPAIDAVVVAGLDQDASLAARLIAGGFLGWKRFGIEGHLAFEGFFPLASNVGTSGRSLTILDLGVRFGDGVNNYTGIFASAGAGFGLFGGNPRERRLEDDMETCAGFGEQDDPNSCKFDVDKNITGRFGLGWGFATSRKTTVAARLDFTYWLLSVDGTQSPENVPAARVSKPVQGFSVLVGLEFMRWL